MTSAFDYLYTRKLNMEEECRRQNGGGKQAVGYGPRDLGDVTGHVIRAQPQKTDVSEEPGKGRHRKPEKSKK